MGNNMKNVYFLTLMLLGCAAELEVNDDLDAILPPEILEPVGVIPNDDCRHVSMGDKACNFRLTDQDGVVWDLYQHEGDIIVLDFSTMWCGPCQAAGHYAQQIHDEYKDEGFQFVTVILDGYYTGVEPTEDEIDQWVVNHGVTTAPILIGSREKMLDSLAISGYSLSGFPTYLYLDRNLIFYNGHTGFSLEYAKQLIEQGL